MSEHKTMNTLGEIMFVAGFGCMLIGVITYIVPVFALCLPLMLFGGMFMMEGKD